ncbi:hypothetical protein LSCM1_00184 [Leishmania martiniquensis]|uniref:Uncharacterized protein n=1 Tax=Leishmania martiniquensis TaxID=1580590 RepID=A0A836GSP7_9TRYP|nr:hypothetical protein LSCM1_00184 [Leishmania martiniquensis]
MVCDFFMPCSANESAFLPEIRVMLLGDANVGKTALLRQYLHHESPSLSASDESTLLDSYTHIEQCGMQSYRLIFTDCSSTPSFREHRAAYLAKCDVVILVYSVHHRKTLLNLRRWVGEVIEARGSAGPARLYSTTGDFDRAHIFVVGTHYGEKDTREAADPASAEEAESITKECLQSAGYVIDEERDKAKEAPPQKAQQHPQRQGTKAKRSLTAFHEIFHKVFLSGAEGEDSHASAKKGTTEGVTAHERHPPASSAKSSFCHSPTTMAPMLLQHQPDGAIDGKSSSAHPAPSIPPGASARLPLFQLSNTNGEAVRVAVRAALFLHLWLQRQGCRNAVLSAAQTPSSSGVGDAAAAVSESTTELLPPLPAALHACTISNVSHTSHLGERSGGSFMPHMLALYSAGLSGSGGGGSTESPSFRNSRGLSNAGQMTGNSSWAELQAPSTGKPPHESTGLCSVDVGSEVAIASEKEGKAKGARACHEVCSAGLVRGVKEADSEPQWCSPTSHSPYGEVRKEAMTNWGGPQGSLSGGAKLTFPSEVGGASASGTSMQAGKPMSADTSKRSPLLNPRWATTSSSGNRETSGDTSNAVEVSTTPHCEGAVNTAGGECTATSGPITQDHTSLLLAAPSAATRPRREVGGGGARAAVFLRPISRVWKEVDTMQSGDIANSDSCDGPRRRGKSSMGRKLSSKRVSDRGLSSSPILQRNRKDGCAEGSAMRLPLAGTPSLLGHTGNHNSHAPSTAKVSLSHGDMSLKGFTHTSMTASTAALSSDITSTKSWQQSSRAQQAATAPLSSPLLLQRGGSDRPTDLSAFKESSTSITSPLTLTRQQQKESMAQCHSGGCTVM